VAGGAGAPGSPSLPALAVTCLIFGGCPNGCAFYLHFPNEERCLLSSFSPACQFTSLEECLGRSFALVKSGCSRLLFNSSSSLYILGIDPYQILICKYFLPFLGLLLCATQVIVAVSYEARVFNFDTLLLFWYWV
jgi:hypothetical protein